MIFAAGCTLLLVGYLLVCLGRAIGEVNDERRSLGDRIARPSDPHACALWGVALCFLGVLFVIGSLVIAAARVLP